VPLIGEDATRSPSRRRNISGDADATWQPIDGNRTTAEYGAGLPRPSAAPSAATSAPGGSGADSRRVRLTWYTSPAAIAARMASTPAQNPSRSSEVVHVHGSGPRHGGPGHGRAGRDSAKRASTGSPSNGSTTAHSPELSRAARSEVTST